MLRPTHRMVGARIPDRIRAAAKLLRGASWLVLWTGSESNDLEPDTGELARFATDVAYAVADHLRKPSGHQHSECAGHYVLRSSATEGRGRATGARSRIFDLAMAASSSVSSAVVWLGGTLGRRYTGTISE